MVTLPYNKSPVEYSDTGSSLTKMLSELSKNSSLIISGCIGFLEIAIKRGNTSVNYALIDIQLYLMKGKGNWYLKCNKNIAKHFPDENLTLTNLYSRLKILS